MSAKSPLKVDAISVFLTLSSLLLYSFVYSGQGYGLSETNAMAVGFQGEGTFTLPFGLFNL